MGSFGALVHTFGALVRAFGALFAHSEWELTMESFGALVHTFGALVRTFGMGTDDGELRRLGSRLRRSVRTFGMGTDDRDHRVFRFHFEMGTDDSNHFRSAEGPVHASLWQRPRNGGKNAIEGRRPDPSSIIVGLARQALSNQ